MIPSCEELIKKLLEYNPNAQVALVRKAYDFAKEVHAGQKRHTYGDDIFDHAVKTALRLIALKLDSASIVAALLHNVLEYTKIKPEKIKDIFGDDVFKLVETVTKFKHISFDATEEETAEHVRKVLLASTKDLRVLLLKLVDKLENMRSLDPVPKQRCKELAHEALEIYAPIAHKLGINVVKSELEDLALRHLDPEKYNYIVQKVAETKEERERQVARFIDELHSLLSTVGITCEIYGRAKSYYSIYKKLHTVDPGYGQPPTFEQIYDLLAVRVIVHSTEDCYKVLGLIHRTWQHFPNLFYDYIANQKPNGYQSIHTKIMYNRKITEVQIRSIEMHHEAEEGIAAHWLYKGSERDKRFDKKINWLKQILEWQHSANARDFVETLKVDIFKDEIVVFTPKGDPITLPEGATILDFAYAVHSGLGNKCARAKVNTILVPLDTTLNSGDMVEILTMKNAVPSRHWLTFVKTAHARSKIRQALHIVGEEHKKTKLGNVEKLAHYVVVEGHTNTLVKFSKCCAPTIGDAITGFKMKDGKISVHRGDCSNITSMKAFQNVMVRWKNIIVREKRVNITVTDRVGLAADILNIFSRRNISISSINTKPKKNKVIISIGMKIDEGEKLERALEQIRTIPNVVDLSVVR